MLDFSITFFFTLINVGILFFILRAILFKPVTKFMEDRTKKIQDALDQAEKDKNQAKLLLAQHAEQMKQAAGEAEVLIQAARERAEAQAAGILQAGRAEAAQLLAHARLQLEAERSAALAQFQAEAAALVIGASSRLLQRELTGEDTRRQAALLLQELGKR
jgi:F-type H+-transporting ATPase subunit b